MHVNYSSGESKLDSGDIIALFKEYKDTMFDAKKSRKLTQEQEVILDKAVATATNRYSRYVGNETSGRNVKTRAQNRIYEESVNSFRNFINEYGPKLNGIFRSVGLSEVNTVLQY